jgi:hypothetical protein
MFYRQWRERKDREANKYEYEETINAEDIKKSENAFSAVSDEVFGKLKLAEAGVTWPKK